MILRRSLALPIAALAATAAALVTASPAGAVNALQVDRNATLTLNNTVNVTASYSCDPQPGGTSAGVLVGLQQQKSTFDTMGQGFTDVSTTCDTAVHSTTVNVPTGSGPGWTHGKAFASAVLIVCDQTSFVCVNVNVNTTVHIS